MVLEEAFMYKYPKGRQNGYLWSWTELWVGQSAVNGETILRGFFFLVIKKSLGGEGDNSYAPRVIWREMSTNMLTNLGLRDLNLGQKSYELEYYLWGTTLTFHFAWDIYSSKLEQKIIFMVKCKNHHLGLILSTTKNF